MNNGSISIYIDNKNNKSNNINIPSRKPSIWIPNNKITKCFNCKAEFGLLLRKHHCRICGRIFCQNCSKWNCEKNEFINSTSPPNSTFNYLTKMIYNNNNIFYISVL